jgi:creatinine amidohydrolase
MEQIERMSSAECYYLPYFPIAAASVNEFYGSIHFSMKTTYDVTYGILESVRCMGFENIVVIASHADPQHQIAVEKAVRKINRKHGVCSFAPMGQIFMGEGVKAPEELENFERDHANDFHAGWIETSSMLAISNNLVRDSYKEVPDSDITDRDMIFKKNQIRAMGLHGHLGAPRLASKELGDMLNENCIASIADAVIKFYKRDGCEQYGNYALYKILPLHMGFLPVLDRVNRKKVTK